MSNPSFGKYVTTELIGRGGMAEVYRARHPALGRDVAIKVIYPNLATDPGFEDRFRHEAQLVASLRHPHIVQLYDFDVVDKQPFMVMEYLGGGTLKDRLEQWRARGQTMPLGDIAGLLEAVGSALDYAHARGAIHRDVKPANVMFTESGEPVLTDFGIAKIMSGASQASVSGNVMGTPAYMSPEQATAKPVDARSDIYSLGIVLYEMATGHVPFQGDSPTAVMVQHLTTPPPPPRSFNPNLPPALEGVILKAIAKDPAGRFSSAGELAGAFRAALLGQSGEVSTEAPTQKEGPIAPAAPLPQAPLPPRERTIALPRWLGQLAGVAEVFAPLLGRQAPQLKQSPSDRRSFVATILGILGIILAAIQFILQFFDLITRATAPLVGVLPYLIAPLFVAGAVSSLYMSARAVSPVNRRRARAIFLLTAVAGIAWAGWTILDALTPPSGLVVLVADFERSGTQQADLARLISSELAQELKDVGGSVTVVRAHETYPDAETARSRGAARKATLVIWGWYDDLGVNPSVEALQAPAPAHQLAAIPFLLQTASAAAAGGPTVRQPQIGDLARFVRSPETLPDLKLFAKSGTQQITYISTAILAVAFYAKGDSARALALFDKALANAAASGGDVKGLEAVYFERALVVYGQGDVAGAAADLQKALSLKPDLYEAHHNLALAYGEMCGSGSPLDRALAEAQAAEQLRPNDASSRQLVGDLERQAGRYDQAIAEFQKAIQLDASNPDSYELLAAAWDATGRSDQAKGARQTAVLLWEKALSDQPEDLVNAHLGLGDAYLAGGDYDRALAEYQAAQKQAPDKPGVHQGLGDAYYRKNQFDLAEREYRQWASVVPKDGGPHLFLGLLYDQEKKSAEAASEWKQAAALSPCDPSPHLFLGGSYYKQNDYANAAREYQAAQAIDPHNADALYLLGVNQYFQNQFDPAAQSLQAAVTERADFAVAHYALGQVYSAEKKYEQAAAEFEQTVKLVPKEPVYYIALADADEKSTRLDDAVAAYQKALALKDDANTHIYLGLVYQKQNNLDAALVEFQKAVALDAQNALAYSALGDALSLQGKLDDAASAYRQAIALKDSAAAHLQLAGVLVRQGKLGDAKAEYQKALALDPQNASAHLALGNMYRDSGDLETAAQEYHLALSITESVEAHFGLALIEYKRCDLSTAVQDANVAAALGTNPSLYQGVLAGFLEAQGRSDDAAKIYTDLQNDPPGDVFAHLDAGNYLYRTGKQDAAAREFQLVLQAPNLNPAVASLAHDALGQLYYSQEKLVAAQNEFQAALKLLPSNAEAQVWLGDIAARGNDMAGALAAYDQAAALLPAYGQVLSSDSASLLSLGLQMRRGLALNRQGKGDAAKAAFDQAQTLAEGLVKQAPQWAPAHFALGLVYEARGDKAHADSELAAASQCDQSLVAARAQAEAILAKLR